MGWGQPYAAPLLKSTFKPARFGCPSEHPNLPLETGIEPAYGHQLFAAAASFFQVRRGALTIKPFLMAAAETRT